MMDSKSKDYCWCGSKMSYRNGEYVGFWCHAHGPQERVYGPTPAAPTLPHA